MSNGSDERLAALAANKMEWPGGGYGPATDPMRMFHMIEWYPSIRDQLVRTRLNTAATVFRSHANIANAYAEAAEKVLEQFDAMKL